MKKKILVTGFEPFGGDTKNPSGDAVRALPFSETYEMKKLILPVSWFDAFPQIESAWDEWQPDALLMVGLAGGANAIRIERVGLNLCGAIKDIDGLYADATEESQAEKAILPDAPDAFFATYDQKKILDALQQAQIPAKYSYSAGTYICNFLLYSSLAKRSKENADMKIGFIHVPYADGQHEDKPSLPMETIISALETVLSKMF
jgi:pyroglutamyl-peptidase